MSEQKPFRGKVFRATCGPPNAQYFDSDGNLIGGPAEPIRSTFSDADVTIGGVSASIVRGIITGNPSATYIEMLVAISELTGLPTASLDEMPVRDLQNIAVGAAKLAKASADDDEAAADKVNKTPVIPRKKRSAAVSDYLHEIRKKGDRWTSVDKIVERVKQDLGCGSTGLIQKIIKDDPELTAWTEDKSVSTELYAEIKKAVDAAEIIDDDDIEAAFTAYLTGLPESERAEVREQMDNIPREQRAEIIKNMG